MLTHTSNLLGSMVSRGSPQLRYLEPIKTNLKHTKVLDMILHCSHHFIAGARSADAIVTAALNAANSVVKSRLSGGGSGSSSSGGGGKKSVCQLVTL